MRVHRDYQNRYGSVKVLIHSISMHFMVNPKEITLLIETVLTNRRCPTLDDYNWFKGIFFRYLLQKDCRQSY